MKRETDKLKQAFTLMELLVVMAIMLIVSTFLVAGYFGMTRAASYTAAENDLFNYLQLARQRACLDGSPAYFMLLDTNSYVLVRGAGTLTKDMGAADESGWCRFYDAYADPHEIAVKDSRVRIWNMDKNIYGDDATNSPAIDDHPYPYPADPPGSLPKYRRLTCSYEIKLPDKNDYERWKKGDRYGFELHPRQMLPKGFLFELDNGKPMTLVFKPDGTCGRVGKNGEVMDKDTKITVFEKIAGKSGGKNTVTITVRADGEIKVAGKNE